MTDVFDAYVAAALFPPANVGPVFALGDGTVRFPGGGVIEAHRGAVMCAAVHPCGQGVVTGGDDGRLVWSTAEGAAEITKVRGWIDALEISSATGLIAFSAGRTVHVRDANDPAFARAFEHERSVAAIAFRRVGVSVRPAMAAFSSGTPASPSKSRKACVGPALTSPPPSAPTAGS
jgi:hypothetical protein